MDDQELIERAMRNGRSASDVSCAHYALAGINLSVDEFRAYVEGRPLVDIGAGISLEHMARLAGYDTCHGPGLDLGITELILVDPFVTLEQQEKLGVGSYPRVHAVHMDGLSYLLGQPDDSVTVYTGSLDSYILEDCVYALRLASEIHRTAVSYLSLNSQELEGHAWYFFPHAPLQCPKIFSKLEVSLETPE